MTKVCIDELKFNTHTNVSNILLESQRVLCHYTNYSMRMVIAHKTPPNYFTQRLCGQAWYDDGVEPLRRLAFFEPLCGWIPLPRNRESLILLGLPPTQVPPLAIGHLRHLACGPRNHQGCPPVLLRSSRSFQSLRS